MYDKSILEKLLDAQKVINDAVSSLTSTKIRPDQQENGLPGAVYECPETPEGHDASTFQNAFMDLMIARKSFDQNQQQRGKMAEPQRKEEPPMPTCPKLIRGCLSLRKDGRWMVRYKTADGHQRAVYERSKYDVLIKANAAIRADDKNAANPVVSGRMVLAAGFDWWIKNQNTKFKKTTIMMYRRFFDNEIRKTKLGRKPVSKILPMDIESTLAEVRSETVRAVMYTVIKSVLGSLLANSMIRSNPALAVNNVPERPKPQKRPVFTSGQMELFLTTLWGKDEMLCRFARFLVGSGLRTGEALGLEWSDIDFTKKTISVTKQWNRAVDAITSPKTESSVRIVPLLPEAEEGLIGLPVSNRPIFASLRTKDIPHKMKVMADRYGMPGLTLHGLRHHFASQCYQKNVDPKVTQKALGHALSATTMDIYTSLDPEFEDAEILKMAKHGLFEE